MHISYKCLVLCLLIAFNGACSKQPVVEATPTPVPVQPVPGPVKSYLALGDSYTIGQSVPVSDRFPVQAAALLRNERINIQDPQIIATTGWTTGDLLQALKSINPTKTYDVVTLLIGVNNQYQGRTPEEYSAEFDELLDKSIKLADNKPANVIVLSIPDYSVTPFAQFSDKSTIAAQIDAFNKINKAASKLRTVHYIDVTAESRKAAADPTLVANDGLHFSGKAYGVWAGLLLPVMKNILR